MTTKRDVIERLYIGQGIAERETETLAGYFLQTTQWNRVFSGDVDIIFGPKGSGKSAIYFLLKEMEDKLSDRGIYLVAAENPQGEPVFRQVSKSPPQSEAAFMFLWKLYFLVIIVKKIDSNASLSPQIASIKTILQNEKLLQSEFSLARALRGVLDYIAGRLNFSSVEGGLEIDPVTGLPKKITTKIAVGTPSEQERKSGIESVDELLAKLNDVLVESDCNVWVVLDRLDVVFEEDRDVERLALRSLFRVYNDFFGLKNISLKIFIRDDIWKTISEGGFREASHFVRKIDLSWTRNALVNMLVKRLVQSEGVIDCFGIDAGRMLASFESQIVFFNSLFPDSITIFGDVRKDGLDWIMHCTKDGNGINTPREVIELLNFARDHEMSRFERGEQMARANIIFGQEAMFAAVKKLSKYKIEQTILSEYPELKTFIEALANRKRHRFNISDLMTMWELERTEAQKKATDLADVGFFRFNQSDSEPYVIPQFYGFALGIRTRDSGVMARERNDALEPGESNGGAGAEGRSSPGQKSRRRRRRSGAGRGADGGNRNLG